MKHVSAEIIMDNVDFVVYVHGKEISRQRSLLKATEKLYKYIRGQS